MIQWRSDIRKARSPNEKPRSRSHSSSNACPHGELAIPTGDSLSFDALQMRLHPAESRIRKLARETPAIFILFDMLMTPDGRRLLDKPLIERRAALEIFYASLDDAARSLGADRSRVLADVHLPLLGPGIATAALLVFVEVLKELPATALLRPLGGDTLAIAVWEATKESRFDVAALPALLIVAVGLVPVVFSIRLARESTG